MLGAHLRDLKANLLVLGLHNLVGQESLLKGQLLLALGVEANQPRGEQDRVLEVLLDLELDGVSCDALSIGVRNLDTTKGGQRLCELTGSLCRTSR